MGPKGLGPLDPVNIVVGLGKFLRNQAARRQMETRAEAERQRQDQQIANPPTVHGSARWATPEEVAAAGFLKSEAAFDNESSLLLGAMSGEAGDARGWLYWDGEGHLLTVAPTRSGKSTMLIIANLLRYHGSAVVLDPKGELFEKTSAWRKANVGPVFRISPFEPKTDGFNPLSTIATPNDARVLAELMIQSDPKASDFFKKDAVAYLTALLLFVVNEGPPERRNMAEVRRMSASPPAVFGEILERMQQSKIPAVANAANVVATKSQDRGIPVLRETLNTDLGIFDDPGIAAATGSSDVDFAKLKDEEATVYITVPFDNIDAYASFLKVVATCALNAMVQNKRLPKYRVLFLLDEFLSLGPFKKFQDAILTHAGAGVRLWFFLQNLAKLEEHYPTSWKSFFDATVKIFFGTDETFTGKLISEFLGDRTVAYRSSSLSAGLSRNAGDRWTSQDPSESLTVNVSVNIAGRPLLTPPEVVRLLAPVLPDKTRHSIITIPQVHPIQGRLVPYFIGNKVLARIGEAK
ncbi:type IV secretory system conjugative DNA transfer family protein [Bradyrhizobium sp. LB11.1]|uniref:type IV secretory system conjugative DNA transfer family protein n=1 Tax=Bradyrhizobium sp. LB11.1 TaxID=3156326 RepID=UPI003390DC70